MYRQGVLIQKAQPQAKAAKALVVIIALDVGAGLVLCLLQHFKRSQTFAVVCLLSFCSEFVSEEVSLFSHLYDELHKLPTGDGINLGPLARIQGWWACAQSVSTVHPKRAHGAPRRHGEAPGRDRRRV
jgi:hypothetical protein